MKTPKTFRNDPQGAGGAVLTSAGWRGFCGRLVHGRRAVSRARDGQPGAGSAAEAKVWIWGIAA
ncbi:MAG: hypothetical protein EXS36_04465 [Pedosphaera sp.]|nr:hypothetical protein [Pedosphaera sp.]